MKIQITDHQRDVTVDPKRLRAVIEEALRGAGSDISVNIVLLPAEEMKELNLRYAGKGDLTDVLAFPMDEGLLGDVAICPAAAFEVDPELAGDPEEEVILYALHGVLHLLGYDDHGEESGTMYQKEKEILAKMGIEVKR